MPKCIVSFCFSNRNIPIPKDARPLSYFRLGDLDHTQKDAWLQAVGKSTGEEIGEKICSAHFRPEDLLINPKTKRKRVVPGAVPCLLLRASELIKSPRMFMVSENLKKKLNPGLEETLPSSNIIQMDQHFQSLQTDGVYARYNIDAIDDIIEIKDEELDEKQRENFSFPREYDNLNELLNYDYSDFTNQIQATSSIHNGLTLKEAYLKRKVEEMIKVGIVKSKIIKQLTKRKHSQKNTIRNLKDEIARLKTSTGYRNVPCRIRSNM